AVDVDLALARKSAQRHVAVARELNGERSRRADADEHRAPSHSRLLHQFERQPAGDAQELVVEWKLVVEQRAPDHLVHRVVAPDILTGAQQFSGGAEESCGVQPPVTSNPGWRSLSGRPASSSRPTLGPSGSDGA